MKKKKAKKRNKWEDKRYNQLVLLEIAGEISELEREPKFYLESITGAIIGTFRPDFKYKLNQDWNDIGQVRNKWFSIKKDTWVIEEFKGSIYQHSYTRRDYPLRRKHFMADFPEYYYIENIKGVFKKPTPVYDKFKEDGYRYE